MKVHRQQSTDILMVELLSSVACLEYKSIVAQGL